MSALLAGIAVIASALVPALPAAAEEPPAPTPVVEPVETPTPDPTPVVEPVETPTPDPTPVVEPVETPAPEPTPVVEPVETPTPEPDPVSPDAVQYSGTITPIADEDGGETVMTYPLLSVDGYGFLRVDTSGLSGSAKLAGNVQLTLVVPSGLTLSDDPAVRFTQLATRSATAPLVAIDYAPTKALSTRLTASAINVSPAAPATHEVFAVLVSPNSLSQSGNQTSTEAAALVTYADGYWDRQSGGSVQFHLAGTTSWYKSSYSCQSSSGSTSLWNQAAGIAKTQLGYVPGKNVHLMLILPSTADCGGSIGLGTIGGSVNSGGLTWVVGGASAEVRKATAAHELGHNMSLGHADWLECSTTSAPVGASHVVAETADTLSRISGCETNYYGDIADVMGFGIDAPEVFDGGSLSSPSAIRSGIWPSSAWVVPNGANQTINAVSTDTGVRAIVVQDSDGTNYFVEFRNYLGDDAEANDWACYPNPYSSNGGGACVGDVVNQPGVRVLRMEPSGYQGIPGYDSFLIGRKTGVGATPNDVKFTAGQYYTTELGTKIEVISLASTTATVKVTRAAFAVHTDSVDIDTSIAATGGMGGVGDTITAFLGEGWAADTLAYQWKRNGVTNIGTGASYVLTPTDLGATITVTVTGTIAGQTDQSVTSPSYGPIVPGTLFYSSGTVTISGLLQLGKTLTAGGGSFAVKDINGSISSSTAYQWYRDGVAIPGATGSTYTTQSADYLNSITAKAVVSATGYNNYVSAASNALVPNIKGTIQGSYAAPTMVKTVTPPTFSLAATLTGGSITESGTTSAYQWYRVNRTTLAATAISGATHQTYVPVSADYAYKLKVRITVTKSNYNTVTLYAAPKDYSLRYTPLKVSPAPVVDGTASPYSTETGSAPQFSYEDAAGAVQTTVPTFGTVPWYRDGTAIAGAVSPNYVVQGADVGHKLTYKMNATKDGYLPIKSVLSSSSSTVIKATFANGATAPSIATPGGDLLLTLTSSLANASPAATSTTIQWYRAGVAVSGKTGTTYQLTSSDINRVITVKVTYKKSGYNNLTRTAVYAGGTANFTIGTLTTGTMTGAQVVDLDGSHKLTATLGTYKNLNTNSGISTSGTNPKIEWLRNGAVISGATGLTTYKPVAADKGTKISVRFTMIVSGLLTNVQTTAATEVLGNTLLDNNGATVSVVIDGTPTTSTTVLKAVSSAVVGPAPVSNSYQWYRDGSAISKATSSKYTLTTSDWGKDISVRVVTSKSTVGSSVYTRLIRVSPATDYSIIPDLGNEPYLSAANWAVGDQAEVYGLNFTDAADNPLSGTTITYQWYINGTAVSGATNVQYDIPSSAYGKKVTVRVRVSKPGFVRLTYYPTQPYTVIKGTTVGTPGVEVVGAGAGVIKARLVSGTLTPAKPTPSLTYKWYREGSSTVISTSSTYTFTSADVGKRLSVKVTMSRSNFTVPTTVLPQTPWVDYTIRANGVLPTIGHDGTPAVGETLTANPPPYYEPNGTTALAVTPVLKYVWYRSGTAISGATASTYALTSSDKGKKITVKVSASYDGRIGTKATSLSTPTVG